MKKSHFNYWATLIAHIFFQEEIHWSAPRLTRPPPSLLYTSLYQLGDPEYPPSLGVYINTSFNLIFHLCSFKAHLGDKFQKLLHVQFKLNRSKRSPSEEPRKPMLRETNIVLFIHLYNYLQLQWLEQRISVNLNKDIVDESNHGNKSANCFFDPNIQRLPRQNRFKLSPAKGINRAKATKTD